LKTAASSNFTELKFSLRHFSYMYNGLGFRHRFHTSVQYLEYAVKCGMIFKNPRSCPVFPVEDKMQKYSKRF